LDILKNLVTPDQVITWLVIAALFIYFIYKEWPEFKRRISGGAVAAEKEAAEDKSVSDRLSAIETDIKQIKENLDRDYHRLNEMERWRGGIQKMGEESLEEREILMQAMIGVLGGLQELGANGPTKSAKAGIQDYINRQAHKREVSE
jgi:hypothetical protein